LQITAPATPEAQQWAGWGTALKPALEPITMARKPLAGTVAANVLEHGTGALNVDGCRVHGGPSAGGCISGASALGQESGWNAHNNRTTAIDRSMSSGRWPANLIHDGSDEVVGLFPQQAGAAAPASGPAHDDRICAHNSMNKMQGMKGRALQFHADSGSAARFFYTAKATRAERQGVTHPTVKPLDLMAYLCRLVTPPGGIVLDPFMGSGTTIKAALSEGFNAIGIERDPAYFAMAQHRMDGAQIGLALEAA
jgi:site-specific DNA-methyltransferase (adenine-specific)